MKILTRILVALFVASFVYESNAQNELDALRYSFKEPLGTARYMGMGGAFGALGGDLSSLGWNPAGLGVYRRNDLSFSLGVSGYNTRGLYNDTESRASDFSVHIPSAGLVATHRTEDPSWSFINFGIAVNKVINFNRRFTVRGEAANTTLLDVFTQQANGTHYEDIVDFFPFSAGPAWNTFLIDTIGNTTNQYQTAIPYGRIQQEMTVEQSGHMNETLVGLGANYENRFFVGATIGVPSIRFDQTTTYREFETDPDILLESFTYTDDLVTTGRGFNIKLGTIVRATKWLQLGAAWHSRTTLRLNDVWDTRFFADYGAGGSLEDGRPGTYDYQISIPSRVILSGAFFIGREGVISADYEHVNYGTAELRPASFMQGGYDFADENIAVSNLFRAAHNVRVGGEWRIMNVFRARAGFSFQQDPYVAEATNLNTHLLTYSLGGGYRGSKFYAEFAYQLRMANQEFYLYDPAMVNAAELQGRKGEIMFSVGLRY